MRSTRQQVVTLDPRRPARQMRELLTEADQRHMALCIDAEARGDVDAALNHYLASPHVAGAPQLHDLRILRALADDVPSWAWSRWICRQAHRWLLFEVDPRVRDAVIQTLATVYTDLDALSLDDPDKMLEVGTALAVTNRVTAELMLYELGGLQDFLDCRAMAELLGRADAMRPWAASSIGGYRLVDVRDDTIELADLTGGSRVDVLNIGAATRLWCGATVIGRLVPISTAPGLMFTSRPLHVDEQTALEVARAEGLEWLTAVYDAVMAGRLPEGFGVREPTSLMSDVVPDPLTDDEVGDEELPGRVMDLVHAGLSLDVANAVATCEVALTVAEVAPDGLGACAPHAALCLLHDVVFEAALEHCTSPDREQPWRRLARSMAEPARSRCQRLADACRRTPGLDPAA